MIFIIYYTIVLLLSILSTALHVDDRTQQQRDLQTVGALANFRLVNASVGNQGQPFIDPLVNGSVIHLGDYEPGQAFGMEVVQAISTDKTIGSVRFSTSFAGKTFFRIDNSRPFSLCGNMQRVFRGCSRFVSGSFHVTATPFQLPGAVGTAGNEVSVSFTIVNGTSDVPVTTPSAWIEVDRNAPLDVRHEACFVMVGRKAYLLAGRSRKPVNIYDPVSRTWTNGAEPPTQLHHAQCVVADAKIWLVSAWTGGYPREANAGYIYIYDTVTNKWSTKAGLPEERRRGGAASVLVGRRIYVSHGNRGGHETGDHATTLGWLDYYHIDENRWYTGLPDAPNPRDHTGGAYVKGRICVAGGRDGGNRNFFNLTILPTDCYDPVTNAWTIEANIPQGRAGASYGTTCDGKLMIAGGEGYGKAWSRVDVFNGLSWTTVGNLSVARHGSGLAVDCVCNQIHIAGGASSQGGKTNETRSIETFFPGGVDAACSA